MFTGKLILGCIILSVPVAVATHASACSCIAITDPLQHYENANMVFVGTVVRGNSHGASLEGPMKPGAFPFRTFEFTVSNVLKGAARSPVTIKTGLGGGDCGYNFTVGTEYLVYAHGSGTDLNVSICGGTKEFEPNGREDVRIIESKRK